MKMFMDAVPNKATKFRLVNCLRDAQRARERNRSGQPLVLSSDRSCGHYPSNLFHFLEKVTEKTVTAVDCLPHGRVQKATKVWKRYPHRAHVMYELKGS
jgi:hypothetical protein